jgi:hypothetical protein
MPGTQLFSILLGGLGGILLAAHITGWVRARAHLKNALDLRFARGRFIRRVQASGMIVVLSVAIPLSDRISSPRGVLAYWMVVLLIVVWLSLLALADLLASQWHLGREWRQNREQSARLIAELVRTQRDLRGPIRAGDGEDGT